MQPEKPLPCGGGPAGAALSAGPREIHRCAPPARGTHTHTHTHIHIHTRTCMHTHKPHPHTQKHINSHTHTHRHTQTDRQADRQIVSSLVSSSHVTQTGLFLIGLEKCLCCWFSHQVDYQTFLTLSDEDLKEVGVSTFGARRKMLLAISGEIILPLIILLLF